jgi:uncharacterized membrane protein
MRDDNVTAERQATYTDAIFAVIVTIMLKGQSLIVESHKSGTQHNP